MSLLARHPCFQHPEREASARCMECARSFCRECTTEHGERLICAECLARLSAPPVAVARGAWGGVAGAMCGAGVAWAFFYTVGRLLLRIPSAFHERNLWGGLFP